MHTIAILNIFFIDDNKAIAGKAGAIEVVVKTMSAHIDNAYVCFCGCGTLTSIIENNGKATTKN